MRALVYHGPGEKAWEEVADPEISAGRFITHRFGIDDFERAYHVFGDPASGALKVAATREQEEE